MPKFVFVTGGVVSSLGKGIVASITGGLLKNRGLKVKIKKIDPYLNIDPGTLSPIEHGEVFVTEDGFETDLDLGHYERLGGVKTSRSDYITSGLIYNNIIHKERNGEYLGKTVMVMPHVIQEFKEAIMSETDGYDVVICEIGGTVGDLESMPILETVRQIKQALGQNNAIFVHVALLPYLKKAGEWKTKPIQHSVRTLLTFGIQADLLLCRMEEKNPDNWKKKLALMCNINEENILEALDADSIYHAMVNYRKEGVDNRILKLLDIDAKDNSIGYIENFVSKLDANLPEISIGVIGKYMACKDAYKSLEEALLHAATSINKHLKIEWIDAEKVEQPDFDFDNLKKFTGILVPGGFGTRAVEGKIKAITIARENNIPYLGICFGMQLAIIESVRQNIPDASSSEFGETKHPIIAKMDEWAKDSQVIKAKLQIGGSMRLGSYPCTIKEGTLTHAIYENTLIHERHRHRYEVNNNYLSEIESSGIKVSGTCEGLVEIIERPDCDFFVACQFHPEFESNIQKPNKLFVAFLKAVSEKQGKK